MMGATCPNCRQEGLHLTLACLSSSRVRVYCSVCAKSYVSELSGLENVARIFVFAVLGTLLGIPLFLSIIWPKFLALFIVAFVVLAMCDAAWTCAMHRRYFSSLTADRKRRFPNREL
jgi:hypothetical protein